MKKILSLILALSLTLCLCACGGSTNKPNNTENTFDDGQLYVGFGRETIMPETEIPLGGSGTLRISTDVLDYLYSTCIAMTEGDETVLLFTQDLVRSYEPWVQAVRERITAELGIPADRIMLCSTHTHSGPETNSNDPRITAYLELYLDAMVKAAKTALEDRAVASLYGTKTELENMTFVRHYRMSDGTFAGSNFGSFSGNIPVEHATEADNEMLLVKFDRGDEKKDILLVNWQAHPDHSRALGVTSISADFIGPLRTKLEKESGMQVAYFTGDTGNLNPFSQMKDNHGLSWNEYGEKLAQYAMDALPGLTAIEGDGIKATQVQFEYAMNHDHEDKLEQAKEVNALGNTETANALAKQYGLGSYMEAANVLQRVNRPATGTMELNAFYVAGMAFITAPYEMFSDNGIYIKENSPFDMTLLCTNANDWNSYCATEEAYDYVSYESSAGHFARGCAEAAADKFVEMLKGLQ